MWTFICVTLLILLFFRYLVREARDKQIDKVPRPKGKFFFGNVFDFLGSNESFFYHIRYLANKHKDMMELNLGNTRLLLFYHPREVEILLSSSQHNDKGYFYQFLRPWLNDGLLLSSGKKWHQRRKILTSAFHFNVLRHFNSILTDQCEKLVENLQSEVKNTRTNICSLVANFSLNSICETAMGTVLDKESLDVSRRYKKALHDLGKYIVERARRIWLHPWLIFNISQVGRCQKGTLSLITSFRDRVIKQRRHDRCLNKTSTETINDSDEEFPVRNKKRLAMLDLLLDAEQEGSIDSQGINEEVDTFMFEGYDTTATALQFAFMLLANHPDIQDKIVEEQLTVFGSSNHRSPTLSDLLEMKYLEACIKESLRLYPPVHFIERSSENPLKLAEFKFTSRTARLVSDFIGVFLPEEEHAMHATVHFFHHAKLGNLERPPITRFVILIFDLHRRADQFIEPLEFRPERFLKEPTWHPFSYLPFSAGQRNCIGQKLAMMEMKLAISSVLSQYRLLPVTKPQDIVFTADIILRTKDSIYVKFEKRI